MNAHDTSLHQEAPHNVEAEQAFLGALLINNKVLDRVSFLEPDHFYEPLHRSIFAVAAKLIREGKAVNPVLIQPYLPSDAKVGDMPLRAYIALLAAEAAAPIMAADYARSIYDLWQYRQVQTEALGIFDAVHGIEPGQDVFSAIEPHEAKLAELRAERITEANRSAGASYLDALDASYKLQQVRGVPIGLNEIAEVISEPCFEAGNLYGLLSSSGEGKTSLTIQLILHALQQGHPTLFLSYDQSSEQIVRQMVAQKLDIEARRQRDAKLLSESEFEKCMGFANWLDRQPLEIKKCTDQTAAQLLGYARTFLKRKGNGKVPFIVVDHISAVKHTAKRSEDPGTIAKAIGQELKSGAIVSDAAWLVLNQRNTLGMRRDNPRPIAADLWGGEPAKAPFDAIFYLYRFLKFLEERKAIASTATDWKKIDSVFPSAVRQEEIDLAEVGVVKSRFGNPHIKRRLIFEARFTRYKPERQSEQESLV